MTKNLKISSFLTSKPEKIAKDIIRCIEEKNNIYSHQMEINYVDS